VSSLPLMLDVIRAEVVIAAFANWSPGPALRCRKEDSADAKLMTSNFEQVAMFSACLEEGGQC